MFYKVNSTKVTVREYLSEASLLLKPIVWLIAVFTKALRLRLPSSVDIPPVDRLSPFIVNTDSVDPDLLHLIAQEREWLTSQQFTYCGDIFLNEVNSNTRYACCVFLAPNRKSIAWVRVRRWPNLPAKAKTTRVQFASVLESGLVVVTTSANRDLQEPASWNVRYFTGKPVQVLYRSHEEHCEQVFGSRSPQQFETVSEAICFLDDLQSQFVSFQTSRGVFEPLEIPLRAVASETSSNLGSTNPLAGADNFSAEPAFFNQSESPAQLTGDDLVVAEVRKLETKQTQLLAKFLLLGVSVVAFLAVGGAIWDWTFVVMLIPILLIHELGHLIAMKLFGYKNVNMFFIPFFGAAVTGRHYNVAGWKKALVSLAGPLPSIALAIVLEIIGFVTKTEWLTNAALIMLILNMFNLLPFLPLDGGWVAHVTLFSRSKYMDIGFRVVAILAMFLATIFAGDKVMMYLGIGMLVGLPTVWKTLKVQEKLTSKVLPMPTEDLIPESAIREISKACQSANLPMANRSQLAATTIRVYEAINTRPTSWPATIGLWALHGGAILVGVLGLLGFMAGSVFQRMGDIAGTNYETISYELPKNNVEFQVGQGAMPESAMLVWQFADEEQAKLAMESLKENAQHSVTRFGSTVLMSAVDVVPQSAPLKESDVLAEMMKLPSEEELTARNAPQLQSIKNQFDVTDSRLFSATKGTLPQLKVTFGNPKSFSKVLDDIEIMPSLEMEGQALALWTIGQKPTADQIRRRRLLCFLEERAEKLPWIVNVPQDSAPERSDFDKMSKQEIEAYWAKLEVVEQARLAENAKLKKKWIEDGLARSSGETKKMIEAWLRFEEDSEAARRAREKSFQSRNSDMLSEPIKFPELKVYLADSADALGYVSSSALESRYGVNATAYADFLLEDGSYDKETDAEDRVNTKMIIGLDQPVDSVAAYSAIIAWLYDQGAESVSISYERVVLTDKQVATN